MASPVVGPIRTCGVTSPLDTSKTHSSRYADPTRSITRRECLLATAPNSPVARLKYELATDELSLPFVPMRTQVRSAAATQNEIACWALSDAPDSARRM